MKKMTVFKGGFALFEVLLAVILMSVAAGASYTLVKSFRSNSSIQQFIRYSTNITQSFMPFLDGVNTDQVLGETSNGSGYYGLSSAFLDSISIPKEDRVSMGSYYYVKSGMYFTTGNPSSMGFGIWVPDYNNQNNLYANDPSYFIISVKATGSQVNQVLETASPTFSIFCPAGDDTGLTDKIRKCSLQSEAEIKAAQDKYALYLVFPKIGNYGPHLDTPIHAP